MAQFELISVDRPDAWQEALERCRPYDTYHLPGYHVVAREQGEGEPHLFVFSDRGRHAALPFLVRSVEEVEGLEGCGVCDAVSAYGYPGLITSVGRLDSEADPFRRRFQAAMTEAMESLGVVALFVRQNPMIDSSWMLSPMVSPAALGTTVAIDLLEPEDEQLRQIRNNHRRDIRRARRESSVVREDHAFEHVDAFRQLYVETMDAVGASDAYYFPLQYFTGLREKLPGRVKLYLAEQDGNIVSGALFFLSNNIIQYHLGGRAAAFRHCRGAFKLILDEVRAWGSRNGYAWLHLGGGTGGRRDSLFEFKAGFSSTLLEFKTASLLFQPESYRQLVERRRRWANEAGREVISGHYFPAYRKPVLRPAA